MMQRIKWFLAGAATGTLITAFYALRWVKWMDEHPNDRYKYT